MEVLDTEFDTIRATGAPGRLAGSPVEGAALALARAADALEDIGRLYPEVYWDVATLRGVFTRLVKAEGWHRRSYLYRQGEAAYSRDPATCSWQLRGPASALSRAVQIRCPDCGTVLRRGDGGENSSPRWVVERHWGFEQVPSVKPFPGLTEALGGPNGPGGS